MADPRQIDPRIREWVLTEIENLRQEMRRSFLHGIVEGGFAGWQVEIASVNLDITSTAASSGQSPTFAGAIPSLKVGDFYAIGSKPVNSALVIFTEGFCTVAGQVQLFIFNPDTAPVDPAAGTYEFLVIHL